MAVAVPSERKRLRFIFSKSLLQLEMPTLLNNPEMVKIFPASFEDNPTECP
jgi:hypothetical protein